MTMMMMIIIICNTCLVWTLPAWWLDNAGGSYRLEGSSRLETSHAWPAWTWGLEALRLAQRWSSGWRWLLRRLLSATVGKEGDSCGEGQQSNSSTTLFFSPRSPRALSKIKYWWAFIFKKENAESEWNTRDVKMERGHWWWKASVGRRKRAERESNKS